GLDLAIDELRRLKDRADPTGPGKESELPAFPIPSGRRCSNRPRHSDINALGMTLYELVTLRPAFDSPDRLKLIEDIKTEDPPWPHALDLRIPRDLETIVLKSIAKDPKGRYQSTAALGADPQRFLDGHELLDIPAGESDVMGLAFSPDGLRIASGGGVR